MHAAHSQDRHRVRLEWGPTGARDLTTYAAERGPVVAVVVDVLSFTTCVSVAMDKGMTVHPYRWKDASAAAFAGERGALLAVPRQSAGPGDVSLSPASIRAASAVTRLVLPSPNGSTISALLGEAGATVVAASLRNARAVAAWLAERTTAEGAVIVVVPAGERWPDGSLRPAVEDLWGAGAVVDALVAAGTAGRAGQVSPEAELARLAFRGVAHRIDRELAACASGRELVDKGYADDVRVAAELDRSRSVPVLREGAYVRAE